MSTRRQPYNKGGTFMTNHPNDNEEVIELSFEEVLEWSQRFVQDTERKLGTKFDEEELKQVRDFIQDLEDSGEEYDLDTIKRNIFLFKLLSNCSKKVDPFEEIRQENVRLRQEISAISNRLRAVERGQVSTNNRIDGLDDFTDRIWRNVPKRRIKPLLDLLPLDELTTAEIYHAITYGYFI